MAVRSREEIIAQLSERVGSDTSDETITLIEDITDTLAEYETRANSDGKDWKAEAERIDKEWREKYVSRFSSGGTPDDEIDKLKKGIGNDYSFEKLFKEGE